MNINKKHIALFLPSLGGGGAERVMVILANGLAANGFDVDLVVVNAQGPFLTDIESLVRVVDLKASRVIFSLLALMRYLRKARPVVMLSALNHANVIALWACKIANIETRVVVSEHNTLSIEQAMAGIDRRRLMPWLMRITYPSAAGVVAVSSGVADDLARIIDLPREHIKVVYNPVVTERLDELSRHPVEHPWFAVGEPPVILSVGRLTVQKDFSTLIKAFAMLRKERIARLVILGEGELRGELQGLISQLKISDDVALPGFVDNPYSWMRSSSLFVLSSVWEGFGNVLVEAMACGVPVVSTDCPSGPAEILENGRWGRMVPVGSVESMYSAIEATLNDTESPNAVLRAQDFGLTQALHSYLQVMEVVCG